MNDYTWPSVFFSYFFFTLSLALAVFFFVRSWRDGYWGKRSEDVKYAVFDDEATSRGRVTEPGPKGAMRS